MPDPSAEEAGYARLRSDALAERSALIEARVRRGEDPLDVIAELPELEDDLVRGLRDRALDDEGLAAQYALARHLQRDRGREDAEWYRAQADAVDARLFRTIGLEHPRLARAAWRALARVTPPRDG
ncbi:hypothetical protein USB125703_01826 [Pseudoclavibacter triregionum]|nr:hypothetical protein USB125703_01826 [Pseudoclavibacter triregionum]